MVVGGGRVVAWSVMALGMRGDAWACLGMRGEAGGGLGMLGDALGCLGTPQAHRATNSWGCLGMLADAWGSGAHLMTRRILEDKPETCQQSLGMPGDT